MPNHFNTYNGFHLDVYNGTGRSVSLCIMGKMGAFWTQEGSVNTNKMPGSQLHSCLGIFIFITYKLQLALKYQDNSPMQNNYGHVFINVKNVNSSSPTVQSHEGEKAVIESYFDLLK